MYKKIRMNIRIYSYQQNDMNEYLNIFVSKKQCEWISEYIRIKKMVWIWYEQIFVPENIWIYSNIRIFATPWFGGYKKHLEDAGQSMEGEVVASSVRPAASVGGTQFILWNWSYLFHIYFIFVSHLFHICFIFVSYLYVLPSTWEEPV